MTQKDIEIISDVIVRFCSHDQYGDEKKAILALKKRLNIKESDKANTIFKKHVDIFNTTKDLVEKKLKNNPHFKESLFAKLKREISTRHDCETIEASAYLNWCYFFYVLK
jgi:hypothetical protein